MNHEEFNKKWEAYLEKGFYGLDIEHEGVIDFLNEAFEVFAWMPNFQYSQIKLKFGKCRFYSSLPFKVENMLEREIDWILEQDKESKI